MKKILSILVLIIAMMLLFKVTTFATELSIGDLDGNGVVNATDSTTIIRYIKGYENLSEEQIKVADVDKNGTVNASDFTKVTRYLKGYEELEDNAIYVSETGNDETGDGTGEKPYKTLTKAFDISNSGKTIKLLSDIEFTETYTISEGEFILDLNGFKIIELEDQNIQEVGISGQIFTLQENAKLTINGQKEGSKIANITGSDIIYVRDNASLTINGGEYIDNTSNIQSVHSNVIRLYGNPTLVINDGYFESENTAINVEGIEENKITINGGEFKAASPISLCDWGFGTHTQIKKCLGEDKVIFDIENNDYAQIKSINYGIAYETIDAKHVKIIDKGNLNLNSFNTVRILDLRNSEIYESEEDVIETYNNYVRLNKGEITNEDLLGYSASPNRINVDYTYNENTSLTINNLNVLVDANNEFTIYEVWKRHNVIYDLNGGSLQPGDKLDGTTVVMTSEYINLPSVQPIKNNYVFGGWAVDKNDIYGKTGKMLYHYEDDINIENYTIYAVWLPEWFTNAQKETEGNFNIYTMNVVGQEELDELINMIPYIKQFNDEGGAKYIFNVKNKDNAIEDLKIDTDIALNAYITVNFNSNIVLNSNIEVKNGTSCSFKLNKITEEGQRSKVGFTGTGSIILSRCYECYIGNTLAFGTSKSAGIYGGTIVLSKDPVTDELIVEVKSGTAVIKNNDFGNVGIDFSFTIDYKLIIDEGAKLEVLKSAGVTGEIQNNGTLQIDSGYNLTIKQGGKYTQGENGEITGTGSFIQQ